MKLWYQSSLEPSSFPNYFGSLQQHLDRIGHGLFEVAVAGTDEGTWGGFDPAVVAASPVVYPLVFQEQFLRNARRAEAEGYDAFVLGNFNEPFLRELRSLVDIPVVGILEAVLGSSFTLADRLALLTLNQRVATKLRHLVHERSVRPELILIEPISALAETSLEAMFGNPAEYLEPFFEAARASIARGAEAVVPAEGVVAELLNAAGVRDVDGVPVVDSAAVAVLTGWMLAAAFQRTGVRPNRASAFPKPPSDVVEWVLRSRTEAVR